jgi:hypothetical protein|tara:strand:+ start:615 stop:995 length:381 start_codon:yes stop_codon:yes gene_type:complete
LVSIISKKGDLNMAEEMRLTQETNPANPDLDLGLPREANEVIMSSSQSIRDSLLMRLTNMSPEELNILDSVITPEITAVLTKLLPELTDLMEMVEQGNLDMPKEMPEQAMTDQSGMPKDMGALGNM